MRHMFVIITILWLAPSVGFSGMAFMETLKIDLTDPDEAARKATWSDGERLSVNDEGLGWDGPENASRSGWILTEPMGVGLWWRPAQRVSISVLLTPALRSFELPSGQESKPFQGSVFVRHSPDGKHWSSWQVIDFQSEEEDGRRFSGTVAVPQREREAYQKLMAEYRQLDVPWVDDEEAMAAWIVEREPDFFRDNTPFIGYVQLLFEGGFHGGQRITGLEIRMGFALSGLMSVPSDPAVMDGRRRGWRFRAPG